MSDWLLLVIVSMAAGCLGVAARWSTRRLWALADELQADVESQVEAVLREHNELPDKD